MVGFNPKINNLHGMIPLARYDHLVISDSNVKVNSNYLSENVWYLKDESAGLVTNLIRGIGGKSPGALFENLHLNSFIIGNVSLSTLPAEGLLSGNRFL